ncbi:hypothetical protein E6C70_05590 [Glaciibacter flavus]|uniref:DUF5302 domain-containing protein n=1 Tax=Orlajensenia flava TaxID=2565934 RepID=A0A4S4FZJ9_9MICO|nr:DUF5302 domain-containing protein [Glaciibacter flavus]THG35515.1 hypothetical protein E6C70_05590 [Glaciibacter flavus]
MSTDDENTTAASEDVKAKFREALDKKKNAQHAGQAHLDGQSSIQGAHGNADNRQEFRRKSG